MKIFLTGGTGFVGSHFISLASKKHFIFALTRKKRTKRRNVKWLIGEMSDNWIKYLKKSNVFLHLAADGVNNKNITKKISLKNNVLLPMSLINQCLLANCKKWIIVGSASEYGPKNYNKKVLNTFLKPLPVSNYEISKNNFSELVLLISKIFVCKCRIMRLFYTYGSGEKKNRLWASLIKSSDSGKNFFVKKPNLISNFIDVKNAVKLILSSCNFKKNNNNFPQIWHIAGKKPIKIKDFVNKIWNERKAKGKLIFNKKRSNKFIFLSSLNSIWK